MMEELANVMLASWHSLNKVLPTLREDQIKSLLDIELADRRRKDIAERLHARYNSLRNRRERAELRESLMGEKK